MQITAIQWRGLSNPRVKVAREIEWSELPEWIAELADGVARKEHAKCYSLVTLLDADVGRKRTNIALVHAASLDFDAGAPPWGRLEPYSYVAYTTPSHTVASPRWRVHIRLAQPCPADDYPELVRGILEDLGNPDVDTGASCDPARLWFSPLDTSELRVQDSESYARRTPGIDHRPDPMPAAAAKPIATTWPVEAVAEHVAQVWGPGVRHPTARAVGGYLARRGWTDEAISDVVAAQESAEPAKRQAYALAAAERAREGLPAPGWDELAKAFGEVWANGLATAARHPDEPEDWHLSGRPWSAWWARVAPRLDASLEAGREAAAQAKAAAPRLVVFGKKWWAARDDVPGTYHDPIDRVNLLVQLRHLGWPLRDDAGKKLTLEAVTQDLGVPARAVEHHFAARGTTWDAEREVLRLGYAVPEIEPARDADVEAWFAALFGDELPAALQWISACQPRYINTQLTACLVLIGAPNTGKSALFTTLATMWGQTKPVALKDVCARFNGPSVSCPIVLDDEAVWLMLGEMSSQEFLERIQQWSRNIELKGQEQQELHGCQRVAVTANNADAVRFRNVRGIESLTAASNRMAWHDSTPRAAEARAALERLRLPGEYRIDLARVRGHIAWIWQQVEVVAVRFAGACGAAGAEAALQADAAERYGEVYAALREAAAGGKVWGRAVVTESVQLQEAGRLLVHPASFHAVLAGRNPRVTAGMVRQALSAYAVRKRVHREQGKYWEVDMQRLPE